MDVVAHNVKIVKSIVLLIRNKGWSVTKYNCINVIGLTSKMPNRYRGMVGVRIMFPGVNNGHTKHVNEIVNAKIVHLITSSKLYGLILSNLKNISLTFKHENTMPAIVDNNAKISANLKFKNIGVIIHS